MERNHLVISVFIIFITLLGISVNSLAELRAVSKPGHSQMVGLPVHFRPTFEQTEGYEFQYRARGPNQDGQNVIRDWGAAIWDWDTSEYLPGHYTIQIRSRLVENPSDIVEIAYKGYELTTHMPVSKLGIVANPISEQAIGKDVVATSVALVGGVLGNELEYKYYLVLPNETISYLTEWIGDKTYRWDTTGYNEGHYRIGVEVRKRNTDIVGYENKVSRPYMLSNNVVVGDVRLVTDDIESPQTVGVTVGLTGIAETVHDDAVLEYQYLSRPVDEIHFKVMRDWSIIPNYQWKTVEYSPGVYIIQLRVRQQNSDSISVGMDSVAFRLRGLQFEEVTSSAGLSDEGESWGGAWGDANNDIFPDLWVTNHRRFPTLYFNNGDGTFNNVTEEHLLTKSRTDAHGTAWSDFDNDGDQDLVQTAGGGQGIRATIPGHRNYLYINNNGYFSNEGDERGISYPEARGRGATWFDWNKDGKLDLFFTTQNGGSDPGNKLFVQQDGGVFSDQGLSMGIPDNESGWCAIPTKMASNNNYSLFVSDYRFPRALYQGYNTSEQMTVSGIYSEVSDINTGDFNGDSIIDIFLARYRFERQAYKVTDEGSLGFVIGTFKKGIDNGVSFQSTGRITYQLTVPAQRAAGVFIGQDGLPPTEFEYTQQRSDDRFSVTLNPGDQRVWGLRDRSLSPYGVYVGYDVEDSRWTIVTYNTANNSYSTVFGLISSQSINDIQEINFDPVTAQPRDILLIGNMSGEFVESDFEFPMGTSSLSVVSGDFDNDMDLDIYTVQSDRIQNKGNQFYLNLGDGEFQALQVGRNLAGGSLKGVGDTVLVADYDVDGFLDILSFNGRGEPPFNNGPRQLFRNLGNDNYWIEIDLEGVVSNHDGLEAVVFARTPDGRTQVREQNGGIHAKGQNHKRIHFGLGRNNMVNIDVHWPSGIVQRINDVTANQIVEITEAIN